MTENERLLFKLIDAAMACGMALEQEEFNRERYDEKERKVTYLKDQILKKMNGQEKKYDISIGSATGVVVGTTIKR